MNVFRITKAAAGWLLVHRPTETKLATVATRRAARIVRDTLLDGSYPWHALRIETVTRSSFRKARRLKYEALRHAGAVLRRSR